MDHVNVNQNQYLRLRNNFIDFSIFREKNCAEFSHFDTVGKY